MCPAEHVGLLGLGGGLHARQGDTTGSVFPRHKEGGTKGWGLGTEARPMQPGGSSGGTQTMIPSVNYPSAANAPESFAWIFVAGALVVLLGATILLIKMYDLHRRREAESLAIERRISNALLRDPSLSRLPIAATVSIPLWRGSPVTIEMTGPVPQPNLREAAVHLALREAKASGATLRLEDRIIVDPAATQRAA